ncbi:MAG: hypothetical protein JJT76_04935 [Clostridiaceae bacterium]|nr:hypothetical protein [Clostridiaceae bacterium]
MFFLFLATLCSAAIALIFKYTESINTNRLLITSANYFIAFSTSLFYFCSKEGFETMETMGTVPFVSGFGG